MLGTSCEYCEGGECGDCESNYECWCESNCEYCQSTCELTVQDACGINVQTTNAIDWTYCDAADDIEFKQVCYGNGKYIALGRDVNDYSYIFSSTDGINWSILTTMGDMWTNISEICFGNGKFVAIKSYSDREDSIIYSSDG